MIIVARLRLGPYSEVSAMAFGIAPPSPSPVTKRIASSEERESQNGVTSEQSPKKPRQKTITALRPIRSASGPNSPAAKTGASDGGGMRHALMMAGAT